MSEASTETSEQRRWIAEGMRRAVNACEELEASARSDIETTLDTAIGMSVAKTTIQIMQKRMLDLAERTEHVSTLPNPTPMWAVGYVTSDGVTFEPNRKPPLGRLVYAYRDEAGVYAAPDQPCISSTKEEA